MLFVPDRRRSKRLQSADPRSRCSRRRSAGGADETRRGQSCSRGWSFRRFRRRRRLPGEHRASGASHWTQRAPASGAIKPGSRAAVLSQGWRAAVLDERASSQPCKQSGFRIGCWLGASEEGSGNKRRPRRAERAIYIHREGTCFSVPDRRRSKRLQSAIRARDVRAADLQEEPTKPVEDRAVLVDGRFVGSDEDGGSPANIERAERAIGHSERQRAEQSNPDRAPLC
jgi:hypothetical protein